MPPTDPAQIRRYARMHDPFNHPTVVYRRSAVLAAGGYGDLPLMEDYALFARMLATAPGRSTWPSRWSATGSAPTAFKRRGGTGLLRSELRLQREFRRPGFTSAGRVRAQRAGPRRLPAGAVVAAPRVAPS